MAFSECVEVLCSFVSVGLGLAMPQPPRLHAKRAPWAARWEQKVQFRTSSGYVAAVAVMRGFEIAARSATLAVFSSLTQPYGFIGSLSADYCPDLGLFLRLEPI